MTPEQMNLLTEAHTIVAKICAGCQVLQDHRAKADPLEIFHKLKDVNLIFGKLLADGAEIIEEGK